MSDTAFETWWETARSPELDAADSDHDYALAAWNARGAEDSKPQTPDTCKHDPPHPVGALKERAMTFSYDMQPADDTEEHCSICAEVAKAVSEAIHNAK